MSQLAVIGVVVVVLFVVFLLVGNQRRSGNPELDAMIEARKWVRHNLADSEAEVTGLTEEHVLRGQKYRGFVVRGKNGFGGPVANVFILHLDGSSEPYAYRPEELRAVIEQTMKKLKTEDQQRLELEYRAMLRAFGIRDT